MKTKDLNELRISYNSVSNKIQHMTEMFEMPGGSRERKRGLWLAASYYAERNENNNFFVKQNGRLASAQEYTMIRHVVDGSGSFVLFRTDGKIDLLFRDGTWMTGVWDAIVIRGSENGPWALAVITDKGIALASLMTDRIVYLDSYPFISVYKDAFIFVYDTPPDESCEPYIHVFSFDLRLIAEGYEDEVDEFLSEFDI